MTHSALIQQLLSPQAYPHDTGDIKLIETHISWVILTGEYVYKIKKPVDMGFLDFSTLEKRKHYCHRELTLNRRLAPDFYLDVVSIGHLPQSGKIILSEELPAIEYAVKMRQFPPNTQLDQILAQGKLDNVWIDQLAEAIAIFHKQAETIPAESPYGHPDMVWMPVEENFTQIRAIINEAEKHLQIKKLEEWSKNEFARLAPLFEKRKQAGFVRDCHGDMHLGNIAIIENKVVIFDCIEFSEAFRCIDIISEIAFTVMDLIDKGRRDYGARLLDQYLQHTGDYFGLSMLPFYLTYRAMVRAKVAAIRSQQTGLTKVDKQKAWDDYDQYIDLALEFIKPRKGKLIIANGVSGSGKTTLTQPLLEKYNLIRLRSDVERKRLFGYHSKAQTNGAIYNPQASAKTYDYLLELASELCINGFSVIVDATFLKLSQRKPFYNWARQTDTPFIILHFHAQEALLRKWVSERAAAGKDASEATIEVLENQLKTLEPISDLEADYVFKIDTSSDEATADLLSKVEPVIRELDKNADRLD